MKAHLQVFILLLSTICINTLLAQNAPNDTTKSQKEIYVVIKNDGTELIGEIISDDGREILLNSTSVGKIYINKSNIQEIKAISDDGKEIVQSGKVAGYIPRGVFTTRYYFTNNALPIKKHEHYALLNLYGPEVHFALSDNFSLGIMTTWAGSPFALASKYSFKTPNDNVFISLGTIGGTSGFIGNFKYYGGLHWGTVTFGNTYQNLSISGGYVYIGKLSDRITNQGAIVSLAWIVKVGKKASLFFDSMIMFEGKKSYLKPGEPIYVYDIYNNPVTIDYTPSELKEWYSAPLFIMPGMRFQQTEKQAFQVALAGVSFTNKYGDNISFPLPLCSWFFKF